MRFAIRPAIETDPPDGERLREVWSYLVPFSPVPLAGFALLAARLIYGPRGGVLLVLGFATVLTAGTVMVLDRLSLVRARRKVNREVLAANLRESTSSEWFGALIGDTQDLVTVLDREGCITYQTPTLLPMLGYDRDAFSGRYFNELAEGYKRRDIAQLLLRATHDPDDRGPYEMNLVARDGVRHATETVITPLRADGADGFVLTSRDVTDRRRLRSEFAESSLRDPLTRLPNRDAFLSRIRIEAPVALPGGLAIALFDLAAFRDLNDSRGHDVGDQVLRLVAAALETLPEYVRAVARTGPDEFGLIVVHDPVEFAMGEVERELEDQLAGVLLSDGRVHTIEFDMGYTVLTSRGSSSLLEQADLALAESRTLPGSALVRYDPVLRSALVDRLRAEADLREALDEGRLIVHYQPVVDLATGAMCGLEALARMKGKDGSIVPPGQFIPVAESLGLINQIGESVLRQSLADIPEVSRALRREVMVSVNVSAEQLDDSLPALVSGLLAESGVPPGQLVLELTETALARNRDQARDLLAQLRGIGCSIALDDFGTGYSSMAYLAELPVDRLKIDRSFVGSMGSSRKSLVLVRTLLQMTHSLGLLPSQRVWRPWSRRTFCAVWNASASRATCTPHRWRWRTSSPCCM